MDRPMLKLEVGAVYLTPSGHRCYWRPGTASEDPKTELQFEYLSLGRMGEGFTLTPMNAQRLLRLEGAR